MNKKFLKSRITQYTLKFLTAICFLLFTAYQVYLLAEIPTTRPGRLTLIVFYAFITVASFLVFSHNTKVRVLRTVLMVAGLWLLFLVRLLNLAPFVDLMDPAKPHTILNFAQYVCTQVGTLVLLVEYLIARSKIKQEVRLKITLALMIAAMVLYTSCLVMECIMILRYNFFIDTSVKLTLIARLLYFFAYVGTAFIWRLPAPNKRKGEEEEELFPGKDENEVDFVI